MKKKLIIECALMGFVLLGAGIAIVVQKHMRESAVNVDGLVCSIQVDSKYVWQGKLPGIEKKRIRVEGPLGMSEVEIREGRVHMVQSPCPDKICEKSGWIDLAGETIICVPQKIIVSIKSKKVRKDIDEIAW